MSTTDTTDRRQAAAEVVLELREHRDRRKAMEAERATLDHERPPLIDRARDAGIPMQEIADRLGTTRNTVYRSLAYRDRP